MIFEKIPVGKDMFAEAKEKGTTLTSLLKKHEKFNKESKLSPLEQQLAARKLQLSGAQAALIADFYRTEDNRILFVETINEMVRLGISEQLKSFAKLSDIAATSTGIKGSVYQSAEVDLDNSKATSLRVSEGAEFPVVKIKFKEKALTLHKHGYKIEATYEAIRQMKINVFAVTMKVLGINIGQDKIAHAINILINGDGNSNPIKTVNAVTTGTLKYEDIVNLEEDFEFFEPTLLLSSKEMRSKYRTLSEYKDKNGPAMPEPPLKVKTIPAGRIIALDNKASLEEVYEIGGSLVEHDKIIDKQIENAVVSEVSGWSILFSDAARMLIV
ncbi:MAG: hypothetical protein FWH53_00140 [Leptospirales bacterium]|nr:hypothetical protein [Leptospirales bacterium]